MAGLMNARDQIDMMRRCRDEIKMLRAQVAALQPRADAYDNMAALIALLPKPPQGYGEDLAWRLDQHAAAIEEGLKASSDQPVQAAAAQQV